ncbi:MAG: hypothetical protein KKE50_03620 [Nanoarchaeota archaeon]|nr:hypothetical protein [Nanoarchaeota archaeon]
MTQTPDLAAIQRMMNYVPSSEECDRYAEAHTRIHGKTHFYLFQFTRFNWGLTNHTLSSSNLHNGNILEIIVSSLEKGTFVALKEVSAQEYARNGGGDIPNCLINCQNCTDGWPKCIQRVHSLADSTNE